MCLIVLTSYKMGRCIEDVQIKTYGYSVSEFDAGKLQNRVVINQ
jgi:hypothetical protein